MANRHKNILKSSLAVATATLLSRFLGVARVMLESAVLGGGATASAWNLAFMWPNLFRRLLGEGALGTALIPLITQTETEHGTKEMRRSIALIFAVLTLVLVFISIFVSVIAIILESQWSFPEYVMQALRLTPLLMPYMIFICLVGVVGAVLNTRKIFFLPALGALLLNIFLIGGLIFLDSSNSESLLKNLSKLVVLSGVIQFIFMLILLKYYDAFPLLSQKFFSYFENLKELWRLTLPGLIGYSVLQISFVVDRLLAAKIGDYAVPALGYTMRIIDLPIGIFAVSLGSVLMANMSKDAAQKEFLKLSSDLVFGLQQVCFICIPMTFFVIFYRTPLFKALLVRNNFSINDLIYTTDTALFMAMGIPLFCAVKIILPAFYARKEMKKPFYVSIVCISSNIILNLILMGPLKQCGIALATVISALLNCTLLLILLHKDGIKLQLKKLFFALLRTTIAASVASLGVLSYNYLTWGGEFLQLFWGWAIFTILYLIASFAMKSSELYDFIQIFIKRKRKQYV